MSSNIPPIMKLGKGRESPTNRVSPKMRKENGSPGLVLP